MLIQLIKTHIEMYNVSLNNTSWSVVTRCILLNVLWWVLIATKFKPCFIFVNRIQEKDLKLKSMEESLQSAKDSCTAREKTAEV